MFRPADADADRDAVPDGSAVFVRFTADRDHGCTVKTLWRRPDGRFDLRPENPAHPTLVAGPWEIARLAVAVERRPAFCRLGRPVRRVPTSTGRRSPTSEVDRSQPDRSGRPPEVPWADWCPVQVVAGLERG